MRRVERRFEDRPQAEVIGLRDRVVLVVMTLGTTHREPQQRCRDNLQHVPHHQVRGLFRVPPRGGLVDPHPQKARGHQFLDLLGSQVVPRLGNQFVPGQLLGHKLVERLVGIERPNHVVAVLVSVRAGCVFVAIPFRIGITGNVEPVAAPPLSIGGRFEVVVDHFLVGVGTRIGEVLVDLDLGRGQTGQVKGHPPQQGQPVGFGSQSQSLVPQPRNDKLVDRGPHKVSLGIGRLLGRAGHRPGHLRGLGAIQRLEKPVSPFFGSDGKAGGQRFGLIPADRGTGGHPRLDHRQLFRGDLFFRGGHVARLDPFNQQTSRKIAGDQRGARIASLQGKPAQSQIEPPLERLFRPMAVEAIGLEDRAYIPFKDRRFRPAG